MYDHYYHPSNMAFFYYGRGPIQNELNFLAEEYLSRFTDRSHAYRQNAYKLNKIEKKFQDIVTQTSECNSIALSFNFGLTEEMAPNHAAALRLLSYLLLEKNNAYLYRRFIET